MITMSKHRLTRGYARHAMLCCAALAAMTLAAVAWITPAAAAPACGERAALLRNLADSYQETRSAIGLASNGALFELLSSPDGATWTAVVTLPGGPACLIASGSGWTIARAPSVLLLQRVPHEGARAPNRPAIAVPLSGSRAL